MAFFSDIFSRAGRVARGKANAGMGAIEDATFETTVRQTVADMKTELNNVVRSSAMAMSNYNQLDAEYQKYVTQSQEWKARAGQALDAGKEDLAKKALTKKAECDKQVASLQTAVESARQASDSLKSQVGDLKHKIDEGERTATTLVARKNAAMAQRKVSEALAGVGKADNAFATLASFEKSVAKEEATAKAFGELASAGKDDSLEAEFAQLQGHSVDSELEALKRERRNTVEFQKELPPPAIGRSMFFDREPAAAPQEDLASLKITDARVRDTLSVTGAAEDFSDIDFTVDRCDTFEAGSREWFEVSGMWRDRRVFLEVHPGDVTEVCGNFDNRRLTLDDFGLTEDNMAELDERQNVSDFLDFEGKFWLYRFSREIGKFSEGRAIGQGYYAWQFQEQDGKRHLSIRKYEGEPFTATIWVRVQPTDVTVFRGA